MQIGFSLQNDAKMQKMFFLFYLKCTINNKIMQFYIQCMEKDKPIRAYLKAPPKQYKVFTKLQRKLNEQRHSCNYIQKVNKQLCATVSAYVHAYSMYTL